MSAPHESLSPQDQAIAWYVRLHSGTAMDDAEQDRFLAWLETPANQIAWEQTLQLSDQLEQPTRMLADESGHAASRFAPPRRNPWWLAVAALLLSGVGLYYLFR